ncbi:MAG: WYL domain-containing protein, partial [Anaerolineae bacterium]
MPSTREGSSAVYRRCLVLLHRLQHGPAGKQALIKTVLTKLDQEAYGGDVSPRALDKRFEEDKKRLERLFGVELRYRRAGNVYEIQKVWEPLLDLPDEAVEAMAFLQSTFSPAAPQSEQIQNFLSLLQTYLPLERQQALQQQRTALEVEWGQRDSDQISPQIETILSKALLEHRLIVFDYRSPAQADKQPRRHTVEPWGRYFDSVRGHYYLRGFCRRVVGPLGEFHLERYLPYRLGRINNLEMLPQKLPPFPPPLKRVKFAYRLAPEIARLGEVTQHPGITIIALEPQADESMLVRAETDDVWRAVRSLLHYGSNCQVLE